MKFTHTTHNLLFLFYTPILFIIIGCGFSGKRVQIDESKAKSPAFYADIAQDYYNNKEYRNTIKYYSKLIDNYLNKKDKYEKDLAWAYYEIGFCYLLMKRYDKSREYFNIVLDDFSLLAPRTLAEHRLLEIQKNRPKKK